MGEGGGMGKRGGVCRCWVGGRNRFWGMVPRGRRVEFGVEVQLCGVLTSKVERDGMVRREGMRECAGHCVKLSGRIEAMHMVSTFCVKRYNLARLERSSAYDSEHCHSLVSKKVRVVQAPCGFRRYWLKGSYCT